MRTGTIKIVLEYEIWESYEDKHVISLMNKTVEGDEEMAKTLLEQIPEGYKVTTCSKCGKKQKWTLGWSGITPCPCEYEPCKF